jgi:glyoxylase-like metal-dependent hydrolase (beta-lactamase superfamily II)
MRRLTFGSITVDAVSDGELALPVTGMFPEANVAAFRRLGGIDAEDRAIAPLTTFVIRTGGRLILVDTGIGPELGNLARAGFSGKVGLLPDGLRAAGIDPERVDTVVLTHLHSDHIGWNTTGPEGSNATTFPNARFIVTRTEWEHRLRIAGQRATGRSLAPIEASGQLLLVDDGHEVAPGVSLLATPGHTPGHTSVLVIDGGEGGVITGDAAHHPAEIEDPQIHAAFDSDPEQSTKSRVALVARAEADGLVVLGGHFPPPTAGTVVRVGQRRQWRWLGAG